MSTQELTLDMRSTALVLIDLQHGIVAMDVHPQPSSVLLERSRLLADAFRKADALVILVTVGNCDTRDMLMPPCDAGHPAGTARSANWSTLVPELNVQPSDILITKRQWGAFYGTELDLQLRRRGVKTIVLGGISTHVGVESTARDAYERGYAQVLVADAMSSTSAEAHANTLKFIFPRIGLIRSTQQVLDAAARA